MKIATWNVNSIKARLPNVLDWLNTAAPDVVLLQETKCVDEDFPRLEIEGLGYALALHGQKTYNGVAILSKPPLTDILCGLPGDPSDGQARYVEAVVGGWLRVASIYVPMGEAVGSDKFAYKLAFYDRLRARVAELLKGDGPFVLGGDFNVAPEAVDVYDPDRLDGHVLYSAPERAALRGLLHLGLTDAFRALHPRRPDAFSWWDYRGGAWPQDRGLRIDHLLLSPQAADRLRASGIDREPRGRDKASDHTPVWCELADA